MEDDHSTSCTASPVATAAVAVESKKIYVHIFRKEMARSCNTCKYKKCKISVRSLQVDSVGKDKDKRERERTDPKAPEVTFLVVGEGISSECLHDLWGHELCRTNWSEEDRGLGGRGRVNDHTAQVKVTYSDWRDLWRQCMEMMADQYTLYGENG